MRKVTLDAQILFRPSLESIYVRKGETGDDRLEALQRRGNVSLPWFKDHGGTERAEEIQLVFSRHEKFNSWRSNLDV